ncbi:MAG: Lrp/AsnC family transcriptional regulator [Chloroflexota bacterium]
MLDKIDLGILSHLQIDGRKSYTDIARSLGVTEGTVRKRAAKLVEEDMIRIIGLVDPHKVGFEAPAIIQVTVSPPNLDQAAQTIKSFAEVSYLLMVSGEYDLMVEVRCRDRAHLATFIRDKLQQVNGVQKTVSTLVLHTYKLEEVSVLNDMEENLRR